MGRLTRRENGKLLYRISPSSAWRVVDKCIVGYEAIKKLAHYEDLEEQGRLIELPCGVGQEAYAVIRAMDMTETGHLIPKPVIRTITPVSLQDCWRMRQDVGMSVFLTKEEAEAKLKELEGDKE